MESSAKELYDSMMLLYQNIHTLLNGFQQASTTQNSTITVNLKKADGTVENVTINSFQKLQQELTRIDNNFKSLTNADNLSYTLGADGSISQQTKTSFINAEYLSNFIFDGASCIVDSTSNIDDLIFPNVKIPIIIDSKLKSDIYCKILEISEGWENLSTSPTLLEAEYLSNNGKLSFKEINRNLKLEKNQIKYFGKFTIETLEVDSISNNIFNVVLNDIKYTGLNTIGNSIDLKIGDMMVSKSGASKYQITSIDKFSKYLKLTRISGSEVLTVGIDNLYFNETLSEDVNIVGVPVKPSQQILVFLSTENFKNISFPSVGIKLDTSDYKVIYKSKTYTIDEFFSTYVTNFSEYLIAFINETTIPANLGIIPTKPSLNINNFKVLQINKHLSDSKSVSEIATLNKSKQIVLNDIDFKQTTIKRIQNEVDTQKYSSSDEKSLKLSEITSLRNDVNILNANLLTISQDIDSNAVKNGLKNVVPKYKVIGFWDIQTPMYSPLTQAQHIIKYEVNYRYLSKDIDTVENTSYNMIDNTGKSISVAFSSWNDLQTKTLNKVADTNGSFIWETQALDSVDEININQLSISINEGESIEIKVRAVSEAGYPISPIKSEWSEVVRIDFPTELKMSSISSTISQNNEDLNKSKFDVLLQNYGLLTHIAGTIKEGEKTFLHSAQDIASGQYTAEQKNIPLDVVIASIYKEINALKTTDVNNNITINLVDFNNETFVVKNNTTMDLFAGNYVDSVSILDNTKWGSIIRKKAYIKIKNANTVPVEIKSLVPQNIFDSIKAPSYYNVPIKNTDSHSQNTKQIFYFRNIDITGQTSDIFKLVKPKLDNSLTIPSQIELSASDTDKNIVYRDIDGNINICKLSASYTDTNFVAFTKEHPLFNIDNLSLLNSEFNRLKLYTDNVKALQYQTEYTDDDNSLIGFDDNDFYSIGKNSCGAFLYPIITNKQSVSVVGDTAVSTLVIPKESEILIPVIFEYRMIDRLGNINGLINQDANSALEYNKKIGIDLLINNELFKFDINVVAKLKSKIATVDSVNISSIIGAYNSETPQTLS